MSDLEQISLDFSISRKSLSVSELTERIRGAIEQNIGAVWVEGEVSNYHRAASGHSYFTLKDETSQIQIVMFKSAARYLKFKPENGLTVIVRGMVTVYPQRGQYQVIAEYMEPTGLGALELALKQLKEKLANEGLFDEDRKRPLPEFPLKIGVVTSSRGAAIRDILRIISQRWPVADVLISPTRVQGDRASEEIAEAMDLLNSKAGPRGLMDVIIVGRGGGSAEDLWAFNEEPVARAIARSPVPVISAVGHEIDFTISDLVADVRAATPTAAAQLATPDIEDITDDLKALGAGCLRSMKLIIEEQKNEVDSCKRLLKDPRTRVREFAQRVDELGGRLESGVLSSVKSFWQSLELGLMNLRVNAPTGRIREAKSQANREVMVLFGIMRTNLSELTAQTGSLASKLDALSPMKILERGYSITQTTAGDIIKDASKVLPGDEIITRLARGKLISEVKK